MHLKNPLHLKKPTWKRSIATTLTAALAITGAAILAAPAASAAPAATPPTQNVDVTLSYSCDIWVGVSTPTDAPTFNHQPITSEIKMSLPSSVNPGQTIAKTPVTLINDFTGLIDDAHAISEVSAIGSSPDVASTLIVNNKSFVSPLMNVKAPLSQIPAGDPTTDPSVKWFDTATGTTSPITVPKDASGDILVQGPTKFTIESDLSMKTDGSNALPTVLVCTSVAGEDLDITRIHVAPAGAQSIDATINYNCTLASGNFPDFPPLTAAPGSANFDAAKNQTPAEIKMTLPSAVAPGATIPASDITFTPQLPLLLATIFIQVPGYSFGGTITSTALGATMNGRTTSSVLQNMTIPQTPEPATVPWPTPGTGTTTPVVVPANASGGLTINAPQTFTVNWTGQLSGTAVNVLTNVCTAADPTTLKLASIQITPPAAHSALTAATPKSSVFGKPATVPASVTTTAMPAPANQVGGTQNLDVVNNYVCDVWANQTSVPPAGTTPTTSNDSATIETKLTVPQSMRPEDTLTPTPVSTSVQLPSDFAGDFTAENVAIEGESGYVASGLDSLSLPDMSYSLVVNGQSTNASPVTGLGDADLQAITLTPGEPSPWAVDATGMSPAISAPSNANGDLTISTPQQFTATFTVEPAATSAITAPIPTVMRCTNDDPMPIPTATINIVPKPGQPAPAPAPTGKVLITRNGKGVAQGAIVKGRANVVIPGTALPVGKSTLKVTYPGDSNTLAAPSKTITVVKTKASPTLAVHVTPGKVAAGAIFPTVNVKLSGPGKAHGGKVTITAGSMHKTANLLALDGTTSMQFAPFATAGRKTIRVSYAGNANFVAKTVTVGLNVTKTRLGKFVVKIKPGKIVAKKTRATLLITLGAPDKLNHGVVTVRLAGHVLAKKLIKGTGRITLPKFSSAGRKVLKLTFTGNGSVVAKTVTKAVKVTKRR